MSRFLKFLLFSLILLAGHIGVCHPLSDTTRLASRPCYLPVECSRLDRAQQAEQQLPLVKAQLYQLTKAFEQLSQINTKYQASILETNHTNTQQQIKIAELELQVKNHKKRRWIYGGIAFLLGVALQH